MISKVTGLGWGGLPLPGTRLIDMMVALITPENTDVLLNFRYQHHWDIYIHNIYLLEHLEYLEYFRI
jgi:hypothetical protein